MLCFFSNVSAQVTTGTVLGTISDSAGQVVPGAKIVITEIGKDTSREFVSDSDGA